MTRKRGCSACRASGDHLVRLVTHPHERRPRRRVPCAMPMSRLSTRIAWTDPGQAVRRGAPIIGHLYTTRSGRTFVLRVVLAPNRWSAAANENRHHIEASTPTCALVASRYGEASGGVAADAQGWCEALIICVQRALDAEALSAVPLGEPRKNT